MRYFVRDKVLELLSTFLEAINYIDKTKLEECSFVLNDLKMGLESIRNTFNESFSERTYAKYEKIINDTEQNLIEVEENKKNNQNTKKPVRRSKDLINGLKMELLNEPEVKLEILFIPYKFSMWDSLESIWEAAKEDQRCNAYVMPIPYYERDENGLLADFNYEIEDFIKNDIPVVSYKEFDYTVIRPDVIYYHNPYDENNRVTSVSPEFYSSQLKYFTNTMVYVPYFIANSYKMNSNELNLLHQKGIKNATKVIVQSEVLKEAYKSVGIDEKKLLLLGTPKIDAVIRRLQNNSQPVQLDDPKGKKSILLNSTISAFLSNENYLIELRKVMEKVLEGGFSVIWRPHPLLEATISSMKQDDMKEFLSLKKLIEDNPDIIMDNSSDIFSALNESNGLITDSNSSIIQSYIMTEKPLFIRDDIKRFKSDVFLCSDILTCYFESELSLEQFLEMLKNNEDPMRVNRLKQFKTSIVNSDGTSGEKIHSYIYEEALSKYTL